MRGKSFRLSTPTVAILNGLQTVLVPGQAIVTVLSEPDQNKLVYALHDGRRVQMFEQDIRDRGVTMVTGTENQSRPYCSQTTGLPFTGNQVYSFRYAGSSAWILRVSSCHHGRGAASSIGFPAR